MKKLIVSGLLSVGMLFGANISLDIFSNQDIAQTQEWNINMSDGGTYYLMLPMDVDYSAIQQSIAQDNSNMTVFVYRWYQKSDLVEADFGVNVLGLVAIKKDSISYYVKDDNGWNAFNNFDDMKSYLSNYSDSIDDSKKDIFLNSYVAGFENIKANKLYLIQPSGGNFNLSIGGFNNSQTTSDDSETTNPDNGDEEGLETPPAVPSL